MCRALKVHRSGYYAWKAEPLSAGAIEDTRLLIEIASVTRADRRPDPQEPCAPAQALREPRSQRDQPPDCWSFPLPPPDP